MWQQQWLQSYAKFDNIALALERMSRRSERMTPLAECSQDLQQYYEEVSQLFAPFYQDLLAAAKQQC
jgi:acyl carrier protein phosphodiesterase